MQKTASIRYNETLEYEYATCLHTFGVFTNSRIDPGSVPSGFFVYYLTVDDDGVVSEFCFARTVSKTTEIFGSFISETLISDQRMDWAEDMMIHANKFFDFEEYFGTKPSVDCKIADAYYRQQLQILAAKERRAQKGKKGRGKQNNRGSR